MVGRNFLFAVFAYLSFAAHSAVHAADRAADWKKVRAAVENKQAQTTLSLLKPLETAAFADQAWGEGAKALLMRVRIANGLGFPEPVFEDEGGPDPATEREHDPFAGEFDDLEEVAGNSSDPGGLPGCVRQLD